MEIEIQVVSLRMETDKILKAKYNGISSPDDVACILKKEIGDRDREYMAVLCLDTKNRINLLAVSSIGSLNSATVHPREVFKVAILSNSASIIIGHNHPSGVTTPSKEDINITNRLKECAKIIGIELLDHLIVSDGDEYMSFKKEGFI